MDERLVCFYVLGMAEAISAGFCLSFSDARLFRVICSFGFWTLANQMGHRNYEHNFIYFEESSEVIFCQSRITTTWDQNKKCNLPKYGHNVLRNRVRQSDAGNFS